MLPEEQQNVGIQQIPNLPTDLQRVDFRTLQSKSQIILQWKKERKKN